jgi:hypothetical protein
MQDQFKQFYEKKFDIKYYEFEKCEFSVDPSEDVSELDAYSQERQTEEIIKCASSFSYFCTKYVKILHPINGLIPFILYKYQRRVIKEYDDYRFNIISKFRQGGLTTVTILWGLWRCLFKLDQQIMVLSKTDREAIGSGEIINRAVNNLPSWMNPKNKDKWNDHHKEFSETGGNLFFYTPQAARGRALTYLIIDEAAFVPKMEEHWKAMYPTISTGGRCIVISTVNGLGNWYQETYYNAKEKKNKFNIIDLDYWEHPEYNNKNWVKDQKAQLGTKGWLQEVMRSFLGSGETYINSEKIGHLDKKTRDNFPVRKLFSKWNNKGDKTELSNEDWERGAMWVWKEPVDGHEYILGADCAEGVGDDGDSSCFQIIDSATLEQVAEFYSNLIPPHLFAQVINEVGIYYNTALVAIENMAPGGAVISNLQNELHYENLFYDEKKRSTPKAGIVTNRTTRPILLEALQHRILNDTLTVNSPRFVTELKTFIYSAQRKRAEAQKGKHDDAIMAMSVALHVRDTIMRGVPIGAEMPGEITSVFKSPNYEEIRKEIQDGSSVDWIGGDDDNDPILDPTGKDVLPGVVFDVKRKNDKILREFGW